MDRRFCVAPMMDRTDRHERFFLRSLSKKTFLFTEMINVNALLYGNEKKLLYFNHCEHPLAIQLGGNDPQKFTEAAIISEKYGYDEVNLNIGCPSSKVQSGSFGAVLMKNPKLVSCCVRSVIDKVKVPVSIKCRLGVDNMDEDKELSAFIKQVRDSGCNIFIIHARKAWLQGLSPKENRNIPPINYERVYRLKEEFPDSEIIINGGVKKVEDCLKHLKYVDGVMMGRKAYEDPYQLIKVDHLIHGLPRSIKSKKDILLEMIPYVVKESNSGEKIHLISKHFMGLTKGTKFSKTIRLRLANLNSFNKPEEVLNQIANQLT
mgnify:FL=1